MAVDPLTGQTSLNQFAGFLDPNEMGNILAGQSQAGMSGQLGQALLQRGYIPNSGFGGVIAQMAQSLLGMKMLKDAQDSMATLSSQKIEAENKAEQAKRAQDQADKQADMVRAIAQATGIKEGDIKLGLQYGPQQSAQATAAKVAEQAALEPGEVKKAGDIAGVQLPFEIKKAYATAEAGEQAKMAQLQQVMAMPEGPEKSAKMTLLLGANAPMVGMLGSGGSASGVTGQDFLKTLDPNVGNQVKALAEGRMQFPSGFALKTPYWQTMLSAVSAYDPSFDVINYNARAATRKDFTSGKAAQTINALNTVTGHLGDLSDAAEKLNNFGGMLTPLNALKNVSASTFGEPQVKEFETNRKAAVDELTRVYRGTGGSEGDIKTWADVLSTSGSPEQIHGAIGKISELLSSKISALNDQYNKGMGQASDQKSFISPAAVNAIKKIQARAGNSPSDAADTGYPDYINALIKKYPQKYPQ